MKKKQTNKQTQPPKNNEKEKNSLEAQKVSRDLFMTEVWTGIHNR